MPSFRRNNGCFKKATYSRESIREGQWEQHFNDKRVKLMSFLQT